jgi:hypothetical protein
VKKYHFAYNKWQRNLFIDHNQPEPLWQKVLGTICFVVFVLIVCFI